MGRFPEPTSKDLRRWRTLIAALGAATKNPRAPVGDLLKAAREAHRAVLPVPPEASTNPFIRLQRTAERFAVATRKGRAGMAEAADQLVAECACLLAARSSASPPDPTRGARHRADLDG